MENGYPAKVLKVPKLVKADIEFIHYFVNTFHSNFELVEDRFSKFKQTKGFIGSRRSSLIFNTAELDFVVQEIKNIKRDLSSPKLKLFFDALWNNYLLDMDSRKDNSVALPTDHKHMFRSLMHCAYNRVTNFPAFGKYVYNSDVLEIFSVINAVRTLCYCLKFEVVGEEKK